MQSWKKHDKIHQIHKLLLEIFENNKWNTLPVLFFHCLKYSQKVSNDSQVLETKGESSSMLLNQGNKLKLNLAKKHVSD